MYVSSIWLLVGLVSSFLSSHKRDFFSASLCEAFSDLKEVTVGEQIAYWIRTPQVPGSRPGWYGTFY